MPVRADPCFAQPQRPAKWRGRVILRRKAQKSFSSSSFLQNGLVQPLLGVRGSIKAQKFYKRHTRPTARYPEDPLDAELVSVKLLPDVLSAASILLFYE